MQDINQVIEAIEGEIRELFSRDSSGHDIYHLKRTLNIATHLQEIEGGDKMVVAISAFVHDVHRIIQNNTGEYCSPKDSLPMIEKILKKVGLDEKVISGVLHCVEFHEEYGFSENGKTVKDKESLIIQDADNLDAMGAVGVARAFAFAGTKNIPMWLPDLPLERETFDEWAADPSEIHHFYSKLLKLKDNMNTNTAKEMAQRRHEFLEHFLSEFFYEWAGKT
ncbi:MAG: HD domain-containing protein [Candidatus Staskawiczbacteria bacterium]|jgi:uncharacterized protein